MSDSSKQILISDACILFDLIDLKLIEVFFSQDYHFNTTSFVQNEIVEREQKLIIEKHIASGKLKIDSDASIETTIELQSKYPTLSFSDCSLLDLALRIDAILLTSDKSLRNIAERNSIIVRGILGIILNLFQNRIIPLDVAIKSLEEYTIINHWAPKHEAKMMISKLKNFKFQEYGTH